MTCGQGEEIGKWVNDLQVYLAGLVIKMCFTGLPSLHIGNKFQFPTKTLHSLTLDLHYNEYLLVLIIINKGVLLRQRSEPGQIKLLFRSVELP